MISMLILICSENQHHDFFKKNTDKQTAMSNTVSKIKKITITAKTAAIFSKDKKTAIEKTFNRESKNQDCHDDDKDDKK